MCVQCQASSRFSRRRFIALGASAIAACQVAAPAFAQAPAAPPPNAIPPEEALKRIMDGNGRYVANTTMIKDFSVGRTARAAAQYPIAAILSCADSRLAPELTFDQGPGELFVVRLAGNFVNDDGLASLEYGVKFLGVPLVMVLGHSGCGAVAATIKVVEENVTLPGSLPDLVNSIKPAILAAQAKKPANLLAEATAENVRYNVNKLTSSNAILGPLVKEGRVKVVGGIYDIATGSVSLL
ncbi:carbonic anhydrase [Microvirga antarctica]|uniref:carbonic anhydrase n=1 Tax=Microvirga antarctica TaxID=2819233 RepID=UPI001B30194D|nr:carbonic anhydrase [Microvirga antarctica]